MPLPATVGGGGMVDNAAAECNSNLVTAGSAVETPVCSAIS
jgi:hypothetical protein